MGSGWRQNFQGGTIDFNVNPKEVHDRVLYSSNPQATYDSLSLADKRTYIEVAWSVVAQDASPTDPSPLFAPEDMDDLLRQEQAAPSDDGLPEPPKSESSRDTQSGPPEGWTYGPGAEVQEVQPQTAPTSATASPEPANVAPSPTVPSDTNTSVRPSVDGSDETEPEDTAETTETPSTSPPAPTATREPSANENRQPRAAAAQSSCWTKYGKTNWKSRYGFTIAVQILDISWCSNGSTVSNGRILNRGAYSQAPGWIVASHSFDGIRDYGWEYRAVTADRIGIGFQSFNFTGDFCTQIRGGQGLYRHLTSCNFDAQ